MYSLPLCIVLDNVLHYLRPFSLLHIIILVLRQHLEDDLKSVFDFDYFLTHGEIEGAQINRIAPVVIVDFDQTLSQGPLSPDDTALT